MSQASDLERWERLQDINDTWAVLAEFPEWSTLGLDKSTGCLILNLTEMLGCLIFEIISAASLDIYLPDGLTRNEKLIGLNVALPIFRMHSTSSEVVLLNQFQPLRRSDHALIRGYYQAVMSTVWSKTRKTVMGEPLQRIVDEDDYVIRKKSTGHSGSKNMGALAVRHIEIVFTQWQLDYLGVVIGDTVRMSL